jgi:hypothetical protein
MMSAKDCVPAGGSPQVSSGDMSFDGDAVSPTHVYFAGMG